MWRTLRWAYVVSLLPIGKDYHDSFERIRYAYSSDPQEFRTYMKDFKFSDEDQSLIFHFLSCLVEEGDVLDMKGGELMVCLPHIITKTLALESWSTPGGRSESGLSSWTKAVHYFVCTNTTGTLEWLKQMSKEHKNEFAFGNGSSVYRCGNVHVETKHTFSFVRDLFPVV